MAGETNKGMKDSRREEEKREGMKPKKGLKGYRLTKSETRLANQSGIYMPRLEILDPITNRAFLTFVHSSHCN